MANDDPLYPTADGQSDREHRAEQRDTAKTSRGLFAALGSGLGCLILGTVPVSLALIALVAWLFVRGCA